VDVDDGELEFEDAFWDDDDEEYLEDADWDLLDDAVRAVVARDAPIDSFEALAVAPPVADALAAIGIEGDDAAVGIVADVAYDLEEVHVTIDGRIFARDRLVEDLVLTRRLRAGEIASGRIELDHDLAPLLEVSATSFATDAGEVLVEPPDPAGYPGLDVGELPSWQLVVPPGVLAASIAANELVAFRVHGAAAQQPPGAAQAAAAADQTAAGDHAHAVAAATPWLEIARVERPVPPDAPAAEFAEAYRTILDDPEGVLLADGVLSLDGLVFEALARSPELLRAPTAPLGELLERAELSTYAGYVAPAGFDWARWHHERLAVAIAAQMMERHDLEAEEAAKLLSTVSLLNDVFGDEAPELPADDADIVLPERARDQAIETLADPRRLNAFLTEVFRAFVGRATDDLDRFANALLPHAARRQRAGLYVLLAEHATFAGRIHDAEAYLRQALGCDDHPMARFDLARMAGDRGDARRALDHLRQIGAPDDDSMVEMLQRYARPGPASAGRNDPCPCGSGRKFKVCCATRDGWPLSDRVPWLLFKLRAEVATGAGLTDSLQLAAMLLPEDADDDEVFEVATSHPLVHDLELFEGGALERFLTVRGPLLPPDELELARSWIGIGRSLFEVVEVHPGSGLTVLDLRSGDRARVRELLGSHTVQVGASICGRLLPDGDGHQFSLGVVPVPVHARAVTLELLDGDPSAEDLAAYFAPRPLQLRNTEGHELRLWRIVYELDEPDATRARLAAAFEELDDDHFIDTVERDGTAWTRAELTLDGDRLTLTVNSDERRADLMARLEDLPVVGVVVEEEELSVDELPDATPRVGAELPEGMLEPEDLPPELQEALTAKMMEMERAWIDTEIPALGGATPREAMADPTRRGDLLALLDEFAATETRAPLSGGFEVARLRALLGLDDDDGA
jgi:hypothetical protein